MFNIYDKDVQDKTYIIDKPGTYIISEDLHPQNELLSIAHYCLINIQCSHVILKGNGKCVYNNRQIGIYISPECENIEIHSIKLIGCISPRSSRMQAIVGYQCKNVMLNDIIILGYPDAILWYHAKNISMFNIRIGNVNTKENTFSSIDQPNLECEKWDNIQDYIDNRLCMSNVYTCIKILHSSVNIEGLTIKYIHLSIPWYSLIYAYHSQIKIIHLKTSNIRNINGHLNGIHIQQCKSALVDLLFRKYLGNIIYTIYNQQSNTQIQRIGMDKLFANQIIIGLIDQVKNPREIPMFIWGECQAPQLKAAYVHRMK